MRDHIFISYATEQAALCDWLARRLAAEGYAVWSDRLKLLGGENWPNDIDEAINERTFRMLALLSHASLNKQNPQGEWLKGFAIGQKLGLNDFVIPLNTEGLRPDEIIWNLQPINYISFMPSWAEGFVALLRKLTALEAPKTLRDGPRVAVESLVASNAIIAEKESLFSNCFEITQVPRFIHKYTVTSSSLLWRERRSLRRRWACRDVSPFNIFAFEGPPMDVTESHHFQLVKRISWRKTRLLDGTDTLYIVISLIRKCIEHLLRNKGMLYCDVQKQWYLPRGLLNNDRVEVSLPNGRKSWFKGVSERTYPSRENGSIYYYHLSPSFEVLRGQTDPFVLFLRNQVYFTSRDGTPLDKREIVSRRKHLCKGWFNKEWGMRTLGMAQLLAGKDKSIRFGPEGEQQIIVSGRPFVLNAPRRIHDPLVDTSDDVYTTWHDDYGSRGDNGSVEERPDDE